MEREFFYDTHQVRYELYQSHGKDAYNWLFFPGGPGADSSYFKSLINLLDLPGNVWLIDLPGNGGNVCENQSYDFDTWFEIFPSIINRFDNPVIVGHSFGGQLPLLFPELESKLKGFVILNSTPSLWMEEAVTYGQQFELPDLSMEMQLFTESPSQETFRIALNACMPYYFPASTLEEGRELLSQVDFQYLPAVWWQKKAIESNYCAQWIPQQVPTLIVGAKYDCICPHTLFKTDERFQRPNIKHVYLEDAGHVGWVESPQAMKQAFEDFLQML